MSKKGEVFLDLETKKLFDEVEGGKNELLGVSVVGIYLRDEDRFSTFLEDELSNLWPILEQAQLVVGFNIKRFDYEVLKPYYPGNLLDLPTLDLLEAVQTVLGFRVRLDELAKATLGEGKTGTGLEAVYLFKKGKIEELRKYCLHDVKITRDIYDYGKKHGHLRYFEFGKVMREFPASWTEETQARNDLQMSLGV